MSKQPIRVLVADDHKQVRESIMAMLSRESDIQLVGTAVNGREAVHCARTLEIDVIVMDISMPELDGIRAAGEILALGIPVQIIMLSMHHNNVLLQQARKNGATGYIMKQDANRKLIPAIRAAHQGELSF